MFRISGIIGSLVLLLQANCGGGDASTASEFATSYCDLMKPCCAMAGLPSNGQQCQAFFGFFGSGYNADKGKACLEEMRAASQKSDFCEFAGGDDSVTCDSVFTSSSGKTQPGQACEDDSDCAPSKEGEVECATVFVNNAQVRKCQVQIRGTEGDAPCTGTKEKNFTLGGGASTTDVPPKGYICHVADGLSCSSKTGKCTKIQPVGGACESTFSSYACVDAAFCDSSKMMCVAKQAVGATCSLNGNCVDTAYCEDSSDTCVAKRADGAACSEDEQCLSDDCVNSKCEKDTNSNFGLAFICGSAD